MTLEDNSPLCGKCTLVHICVFVRVPMCALRRLVEDAAVLPCHHVPAYVFESGSLTEPEAH